VAETATNNRSFSRLTQNNIHLSPSANELLTTQPHRLIGDSQYIGAWRNATQRLIVLKRLLNTKVYVMSGKTVHSRNE